jgi:hypothetical protein
MSTKTINVPVTPEEALKLLGLTEHPGYAVLVKIMSFGADAALRDGLTVDMTDNAKIIAAAHYSRAAKDFYDRVCNTVDWIVQETAFDKANPSADSGADAMLIPA